jgi:diguanylate cyclase (GGDEF)-like protein
VDPERKFKVLVVDDSPTVRKGIVFALRRSGMAIECQEAADGLEALQILGQATDMDLVLCDVQMPGLDGFQVVDKVRAEARLRDLPIIILTAEASMEHKVQGLTIGASDYVVKPFDPQELLARVRVQLKVKALQDELRQLSITDPLTGVYNRRYFLAELARELGRSRQLGLQMGFAILDIDHFKLVNDEHDHLVGDHTLVEFAQLLRAHTRPVDLVGRYGGEEFVILFPHTDKAETRRVLEALRQTVAEHAFPHLTRPLTVSIGMCSYPNDEVDTVDDLIRQADRALFKAKGEGRNRIIVAA